jgi:hypothetical protein
MRVTDAWNRVAFDRLRALIAIAVPAGLLGAAGEAKAAFVLDTGTPTGGSQLVLSTAQSFAAEFSITAGQTVTSLAAYLKPNTGNAPSFEFEIFSNSPSFLTNRNPTLVYSVSFNGSSLASGWNSVAANWTPTTTGNYWLAILEPNTGTTLDVQSETSTATGTVPALEFASTNTPGNRYNAFGTGIGLEVNAVPLPAAAWLMLSGLGGLAASLRKRNAT